MSQVVIGDILPYTQAIAIASQTVFMTNWTANVASDIVVYQTPFGSAPNDATQLLANPAAYSVSFIGSSQEVQVTLVTGANAGDIITITRMTPADRVNLYSNTNFVPSMLNNDFGILTLVDQQAQLVNQLIGPRYNYSADITDIVDTILPILLANQVWVKNPNNTGFIGYTLPPVTTGIAPANATYILQTANGALPNSQALSALGANSLLAWNNAEEIIIATSIAGTANEISVTNGNGSGTIGISIPNNPVMPGTGALGLPSGTTLQRLVTDGTPFRYNSNFDSLEFYSNGTWSLISDDTDGIVLPGTINQLPYYAAAGTTLSAIGPLTNGELLIGSTGAAPVPATLSAGSGVSISVGAGSITISASGSGGTVTSITAGTGLSGGTITSTGTISLTAPVAVTLGGTGLTTITANSLLYASSLNTIAALASANNSVLITSNTGVPSLSTNLPAGLTTTDPTTAQGIATKNYVDQNALTGTSVYAASAATLGTVTQSGAGVGATLTNAGTQATFALDGVNPPVGVNVLIKTIGTGYTSANLGIYILSNAGSNSTNWILTRATSYDSPTEINRTGLIAVQNGSTLSGTAWYNSATITTVDTTAFTYVEFGTKNLFSINIQVFNSAGTFTYTPSPGMVNCIAEVQGGGAGSGGAAAGTGTASASGGAGAGSYSRSNLTATQIGSSQVVTVGAAGLAGTSGTGMGGNGGSSSLGSLVTATGGTGSSPGNATTTSNYSGAAGVGGTVGTGQLALPGGGGYSGIVVNGAAGIVVCGIGGTSFFGSTSGMVGVSGQGLPGSLYGAGASGATALANANVVGLAGSVGCVIITEYILT